MLIYLYEGFAVLFRYMDIVDAERFLTLVQREKFDYTQWREHLLKDWSLEEISTRAMNYVRATETPARGGASPDN